MLIGEVLVARPAAAWAEKKKMYAFPSQELPCSGSTGIISAAHAHAIVGRQHPEE